MERRRWVYAKLPKTGLGNMLLVWARAAVFARTHQLPMVTSFWWGLRWGAWKRNEKKKRVYWGYFKESSIRHRLRIVTQQLLHAPALEPSLQTRTLEKTQAKLFVFTHAGTGEDLFAGLREHQLWIKEALLALLTPTLLQQWQQARPPEIAVHIRRGDFKWGNPLTPLCFYRDGIAAVRDAAGSCLPVTVFTDANKEEIAEILALPHVYLAAPQPDILDILLMSRSKVLLLAQSSTFSYWAAFFSQAVVIRTTGDWQPLIKENTPHYHEINWDYKAISARESLVNRLRNLPGMVPEVVNVG